MAELNPKKAALKASAAQMARILDAGGAEMLDGGLPELLSLKAGQQVGARRFTLVRRLGRGGMGVVWLAHDTRLDESVALKFLPPQISSDPAALNDLRRETVRSHHLTHPNIIRIHDFHQTDDVAFISMEYVDGATLSDRRLQQTRQVLTWAQLTPLVQQLCAALEYAHGEKVIHRDLKPSNMMVDSKGRLKLADFGIAAVASDSMSRVSVQHASSGTPPYMSPQQLVGKRPQVTDDIYALGATLYELMTGKPPFYTGDITHQVMNQKPEPMEERLAAFGIDNEIPPAVSAMVMGCLVKEPEQRPQSARAVAEWIGLESQVKPATDSAAAAFFRPTPSSPGSLLADHPAGNVPARPAVWWRNLAAVGIVALVLAAALWLRKEILHRDHSIAPVAAGISAEPRLRPEALWGKRFIFNFKSDSNAGSNGRLTLQTNGTIAGTKGPNESFWLIDRDGHLVFKHLDGRVSTIFTVTEHRDGKWYFCGQYQFNPRVQNFLEEDVTSDAATTMTGTKTPAVAPQQDAGTLAGSDAKPRVNGFDWTLDTSQSPDLNDWAETKLKPVVDQWYPLLVDYFASDGFTAPKRFKITISPRGGNVSFAGTNIQLSGAFVRNEISKPGDWNQATGSVIWALARVVQQYGNPPWLAYGVANYYRWFCYEPAGHRPKMSAQSAAGHNYSDTNITTECFLDYVVKNHDPKIVSKMNAAMRQGHYSPDLWKEYTGMSVEDLWAEYVKSL